MVIRGFKQFSFLIQAMRYQVEDWFVMTPTMQAYT